MWRALPLGTNGFHVKAKNEKFTAASSRCRQNLKYENFTSWFGRLRQNIAPRSVPHVQHDYFSSFNQSIHWFVVLSLTLPSSNLELSITARQLVVLIPFFFIFAICSTITLFKRTTNMRLFPMLRSKIVFIWKVKIWIHCGIKFDLNWLDKTKLK